MLGKLNKQKTFVKFSKKVDTQFWTKYYNLA